MVRETQTASVATNTQSLNDSSACKRVDSSITLCSMSSAKFDNHISLHSGSGPLPARLPRCIVILKDRFESNYEDFVPCMRQKKSGYGSMRLSPVREFQQSLSTFCTRW